MLKILVKKQLTEIFRSYFYNPKNNKSRSKAAVAGYIALFVVLMVGVLGGMFTMLALGLCGPLAAVGSGFVRHDSGHLARELIQIYAQRGMRIAGN